MVGFLSSSGAAVRVARLRDVAPVAVGDGEAYAGAGLRFDEVEADQA